MDIEREIQVFESEIEAYGDPNLLVQSAKHDYDLRVRTVNNRRAQILVDWKTIDIRLKKIGFEEYITTVISDEQLILSDLIVRSDKLSKDDRDLPLKAIGVKIVDPRMNIMHKKNGAEAEFLMVAPTPSDLPISNAPLIVMPGELIPNSQVRVIQICSAKARGRFPTSRRGFIRDMNYELFSHLGLSPDYNNQFVLECNHCGSSLQVPSRYYETVSAFRFGIRCVLCPYLKLYRGRLKTLGEIPCVRMSFDHFCGCTDVLDRILSLSRCWTTFKMLSKFFSSYVDAFVFRGLIPRYYYTDSSRLDDSDTSAENSVDYNDEVNHLDRNFRQLLEIPRNFFRYYRSLDPLTLGEEFSELYKFKSDFLLEMGPKRIDLHALSLDRYHPKDLLCFVIYLDFNDEMCVDSFVKCCFCYFNKFLKTYLVDACKIPQMQYENFIELNLLQFSEYILSPDQLKSKIYLTEFWDEEKFRAYENLMSRSEADVSQYFKPFGDFARVR